MNDSDFPEFFMPAIRQMLIVCFALAWPTIAVAQEASDASDIQAMRYATQELKIEFRPSMAEEEQLRKLLMSTPLPLTIREGFIDAGAQDRWSLRALNRRANMSFSVAGIQKVNEGLLRALNED
ncbi:MAG: hypothetical protein AAGK24_05565, partial [Planctomycetota bacterium]